MIHWHSVQTPRSTQHQQIQSQIGKKLHPQYPLEVIGSRLHKTI